MSLHQLATTINASEEQTQVTFEKIDFLLKLMNLNCRSLQSMLKALKRTTRCL